MDVLLAMLRKEIIPMKLLRMLTRSFRDASKSLVRNFSLSLASIVCITITLTLLGSFLVGSLNIKNFTNSIKGDVGIVVFLDSNITEDKISKIGEQIKEMSNIKSVKLETKEEIKARLQAESEVFDTIMSNWSKSENPLSDTYNIKVTNVDYVSNTAKAIEKIPGVKMVDYGANFITDLLGMFKTVEKIGIIAIVSLIIVTGFLIINTIKLTIIARKDEINIMRLVGASNTAIKAPFVIEGLFLGLIGSLLPIGLVVYGYSKLYSETGGIFFSPIIKLIKPEPFIYQISLILLIMGILVGMWGSARAVRKYLKI